MHFLFVAGDILETRPIAFDEVRKGDVVVFQRAGKAIVHRVWRVGRESLWTIGDNNPRCDNWLLSREDTLALVEFRVDRKQRRIPVRRGWLGMIRFYWDRWLRFLLRCLFFVLRRVFRIFDWRKPLPAPEKFGDELCYSANGRIVAWKNLRTGVTRFSGWTDRLKYRSM